MVADLGAQNLDQQAYETMVDKAVSVVSTAVQEFGQLQSRLGAVQQRVSDASDRMSVQSNILTSQINSLETVDPYETATRVSTLMNQVESSYALTARIMGLSILNYL